MTIALRMSALSNGGRDWLTMRLVETFVARSSHTASGALAGNADVLQAGVCGISEFFTGLDRPVAIGRFGTRMQIPVDPVEIGQHHIGVHQAIKLGQPAIKMQRLIPPLGVTRQTKRRN